MARNQRLNLLLILLIKEAANDDELLVGASRQKPFDHRTDVVISLETSDDEVGTRRSR